MMLYLHLQRIMPIPSQLFSLQRFGLIQNERQLYNILPTHFGLIYFFARQLQSMSQRAVFSLRGTNISLPNTYKIRKFRAGNPKKPKIEHQETDPQLPIRIEAKQTIPLQTHLDTLRKTNQTHQSQHPSSQIFTRNIPFSSNHTIKFKQAEQLLSVSNPKLNELRDYHTSVLKRGREHYSSMKTKRCACGDCEDCMKDFGYFLQLFSDDNGVPDISAKSWCVWKKKNGRYMHYYGKRIHKVREIASLSKMMTGLTAIQLLGKYKWDPARIYYQVRRTSIMVGGTSANLSEGQVCSLLQLFYGMMLPSGNDAAIALSEAIGLLVFLKSKGKLVNPEGSSQWFLPFKEKNYSNIFIGLMNERCQRLGTLDTKFFNSHGNDAYDQLKNISTCNQVAKIASEFMQSCFLREIVGCSRYGDYINTNKLLQDGFDGIKTGITDSAGPCLAASYKDFIIVVLNSKSMGDRWIQVKKLVKWMMKKH